ncbi:hypothetical protein F5Y14DRAFT_28940 [Nemania sp. NC0429]|nr:hypothetical protein F5Y14DRAFT_28940 [Nemania sp. NC0429]
MMKDERRDMMIPKMFFIVFVWAGFLLLSCCFFSWLPYTLYYYAYLLYPLHCIFMEGRTDTTQKFFSFLRERKVWLSFLGAFVLWPIAFSVSFCREGGRVCSAGHLRIPPSSHRHLYTRTRLQIQMVLHIQKGLQKRTRVQIQARVQIQTRSHIQKGLHIQTWRLQIQTLAHTDNSQMQRGLHIHARLQIQTRRDCTPLLVIFP